MFRIFDDDNSGTIDFEEFILALNATKSGILIIFMTTFISVTVRMTTPDQKLQWIFNVFDRCKYLSLFASESSAHIFNKGWWRNYRCPGDSRNGVGTVCDVRDGGE